MRALTGRRDILAFVDELLPNDNRVRWILERSAGLVAGGAEPVSGLVLPTNAFFPDHFDATNKGVRRLLKRVVKLAGLSDVDVTAEVVSVEGESGGGCSTGACGVGGAPAAVQRVVQRGDGWTVNVVASETGNPVVLTTAMVRAVSHIFLKEADLYGGFNRSTAEAGADLCGVLLGFGTLLCNGAYIYKKG